MFDNLFSETGEFRSPFLGLETEHFQKKHYSKSIVTVSIQAVMYVQ